MKLKGTVSTITDTGTAIRIKLVNVRSVSQAHWKDYQPGVEFDINYSAQKSYPIGKQITVEIKP